MSRRFEFYYQTNKKVIDKMKYVIKGVPIGEIDGLKSNMYSLTTMNNKEFKRTTGFNKSILSSNIRHKQYVYTLFRKEKIRNTK